MQSTFNKLKKFKLKSIYYQHKQKKKKILSIQYKKCQPTHLQQTNKENKLQ